MTSLGDVVEHDALRGLLAQHLKHTHRGAIIRPLVGQQHVWMGRVGGSARNVEVISQGIRLACQHEGMFLIRVVPYLVWIILRIDATLGLKAAQRAATIVAGQHNFLRCSWPLKCVPRQGSRPVGWLKSFLGVGSILSIPVDFKNIIIRIGVHRDNGS